MPSSDAPPATASGPGVPYSEWPAALGDPRWHRSDQDHESTSVAKSRRDIVAQYRRQRPEIHTSISPKEQLARAHEVERSPPLPTRRCSFQVQCQRGRATKKCHHCIQFDPLHLGYYCEACFAMRHPPYRMTHAWSPLEDEVNPDRSWMTHLVYHNLEQDAQELELLLAQTQSFLQSNTSLSKLPSFSRPDTRSQSKPPFVDPLAKMRTPTGDLDFQRVRESVSHIATTLKSLVEQIRTELAKRPMTREDALVKIQTMWRIRKARKQMRELLRSVYQSFTDPSTGKTYYYNTRTKETKWIKPKALGSGDLPVPTPSRNQNEKAQHCTRTTKARELKLHTLMDPEERRGYAAKCIQGMARAHSARRHFRQLISSVYEKIWDSASKRFYYHNTKTNEVKWERPRWVSDSELLTPRTRDAMEEQAARELQQQKLAKLRATMTVDAAAGMVQNAFRKRRGFRLLLEMSRGVYERIYDAEAEMYYYHNTRTDEVMWAKPLLLRNANADVFTPRSRETHLQSLLASAMARSKPRCEWTEETAAVMLQGLYRVRCAKRELDTRLAAAYKKVWDPSSERFYYANLATGAVSWDTPAILMRRSDVPVEELQ